MFYNLTTRMLHIKSSGLQLSANNNAAIQLISLVFNKIFSIVTSKEQIEPYIGSNISVYQMLLISAFYPQNL